jgi:hypothetical protein
MYSFEIKRKAIEMCLQGRQKWRKSRAGNSVHRPTAREGEKVLKRKFCRLRLEKEMQRVQGFRKTDEMAGNEK